MADFKTRNRYWNIFFHFRVPLKFWKIQKRISKLSAGISTLKNQSFQNNLFYSVLNKIMIWESNFQKCWVYESKIMFEVPFLEHFQYWLVSSATKLIQIELSPKCVTGMKYLLKIRIQRKIWRQIVCVNTESIVVLYPFSIKLAFNAHAIFIFIWNVGEININTNINTYNSTPNFTLNPNFKLNSSFRPRICEKIRFENFSRNHQLCIYHWLTVGTN